MTIEKKMEVVKEFEKGIELYKGRKFEEALKTFNGALAIDPTDGPSKVYVERCEAFIKEPPPEDWDGVFVMKTK